LRRQPYVLLFPLGVALSWAGLLHWLAFSLGWSQQYRPRFHALVQTQGFVTCMALGFLLTMIPRRTASSSPATWQVFAVALGPVLMAASAWVHNWQMAQLCWLLTAVLAAQFVGVRLARNRDRRQPIGFVWIPVAFLMGIGGSLLAYGIPGLDAPGWTLLGTRLAQQGMLIALVLGVGSLALPLMTRGEGISDAAVAARPDLVRFGHAAAAVLVVASFWLESAGQIRAGMLLRGATILVVLLADAEIWRAPRRPGWNARVILAAAWLVPTGYVLAAAFPRYRLGGLHVSFIGGFALLSLAVSTQVALGHGGYREILLGKPLQMLWMTTLVGSAAAARWMMESYPADRVRWMGWATALFLLATVLWLRLVAPGLLVPRNTDP